MRRPTSPFHRGHTTLASSGQALPPEWGTLMRWQTNHYLAYCIHRITSLHSILLCKNVLADSWKGLEKHIEMRQEKKEEMIMLWQMMRE